MPNKRVHGKLLFYEAGQFSAFEEARTELAYTECDTGIWIVVLCRCGLRPAFGLVLELNEYFRARIYASKVDLWIVLVCARRDVSNFRRRRWINHVCGHQIPLQSRGRRTRAGASLWQHSD